MSADSGLRARLRLQPVDSDVVCVCKWWIKGTFALRCHPIQEDVCVCRWWIKGTFALADDG